MGAQGTRAASRLQIGAWVQALAVHNGD